jgi:hypothetical protein
MTRFNAKTMRLLSLHSRKEILSINNNISLLSRVNMLFVLIIHTNNRFVQIQKNI